MSYPRSSGTSARCHPSRRKSPRCLLGPLSVYAQILVLPSGTYTPHRSFQQLARFTADLTAQRTRPFLKSMQALMIRGALAPAVVKAWQLEKASHTSSCISDSVADRCSSSSATFFVHSYKMLLTDSGCLLSTSAPQPRVIWSLTLKKIVTLVILHLFAVYFYLSLDMSSPTSLNSNSAMRPTWQERLQGPCLASMALITPY